MTFGDLAALVQTHLKPDGDKLFATVSSNYYSSPFGIALTTILKSFSVDTFLHFTSNTAITVTTGDREFSFADPANCALNLFSVQKVWLNNIQLCRRDSVQDVLGCWRPSTPSGTPAAFAQLDPQAIVFDVACSANQPNSYVQGWYRHPTPTSDSDTVLIPEEVTLLFTRYAQVFLREDAAGDDLGMARLQRHDKSAFEGIMKLRGQMLRRHIGGRL